VFFWVNVVALLIRLPQIAAAVECDGFKVHELRQGDSKDWIDVLISGGQRRLSARAVTLSRS
jgi:hypothetical protein